MDEGIFAAPCRHCQRQGFLWKRNYCSYCGRVDDRIPPERASELRRDLDLLYDRELSNWHRHRTGAVGTDSGWDDDSYGSYDVSDSCAHDAGGCPDN